MQQADEEQTEFIIPAGKKGHVEEMTWTWTLPDSPFGLVSLQVYMMGTHMHYVGRDMRVTLEHGEFADAPGTEECLVHTPAWDYNWQRGYEYDGALTELPVMRKGDVIRMTCIYDNHMDNRFVRDALREQGLDAPRDVLLGDDTLDEMCIAAVGIMYPNERAFQPTP